MTGTAAVPVPARHTAPDPGFGIYLHWPFCRAKCPYCDFNSHVRPQVDHARWRRALLAELEHAARETAGREPGGQESGRRRVTSIFFGGGTPSLMVPETVAAVIARTGELFELDPDAEITLEANPTSSEAARFAGFRAAGVNRISLGVQALDDAALAFLGREHSAAEALAAVDLARRHVPRISFDLIAARPGQSVAGWRAELARALAHTPEHISIYQLTIEPNTPFHAAWRRGELHGLDDDTAAAIYEATGAALAEAGLRGYEVSNYARPGAESRHNLTYWRYGDYLGIGPGAHGRIALGGEKLALRRHRAPEAWLRAVEAEGHATRARTPLSREERLSELVMMGLRLEEGIARGAFHRELGAEPEGLLPAGRLAALIEEGYLTLDRDRLRATEAGRLRLDAVLGHLLA